MPPEDVVFLLGRLRPSTDVPSDRSRVDDRSVSTTSERGSVVAVGGPSGSGARELAVALAARWGPACRRLLVDCNETTPGVARRLGLALYPHILTAIDRWRTEGLSGIDAALADRSHRCHSTPIAGLATPRDWDRLVAHDVVDMLDTVPRRVGASRRHDEPTRSRTFSAGATGSESAGRVLRSADVVVGCAEPTPRGTSAIPRLADRRRLLASGDADRCSTRCPRPSASPPRSAGSSSTSAGDLEGARIEIPFDRRVATAEWDGTIVGQGPFAKAVAGLGAELDRVLITERLER